MTELLRLVERGLAMPLLPASSPLPCTGATRRDHSRPERRTKRRCLSPFGQAYLIASDEVRRAIGKAERRNR